MCIGLRDLGRAVWQSHWANAGFLSVRSEREGHEEMGARQLPGGGVQLRAPQPLPALEARGRARCYPHCLVAAHCTSAATSLSSEDPAPPGAELQPPAAFLVLTLFRLHLLSLIFSSLFCFFFLLLYHIDSVLWYPNLLGLSLGLRVAKIWRARDSSKN